MYTAGGKETYAKWERQTLGTEEFSRLVQQGADPWNMRPLGEQFWIGDVEGDEIDEAETRELGMEPQEREDLKGTFQYSHPLDIAKLSGDYIARQGSRDRRGVLHAFIGDATLSGAVELVAGGTTVHADTEHAAAFRPYRGLLVSTELTDIERSGDDVVSARLAGVRGVEAPYTTHRPDSRGRPSSFGLLRGIILDHIWQGGRMTVRVGNIHEPSYQGGFRSVEVEGAGGVQDVPLGEVAAMRIQAWGQTTSAGRYSSGHRSDFGIAEAYPDSLRVIRLD